MKIDQYLLIDFRRAVENFYLSEEAASPTHNRKNYIRK